MREKASCTNGGKSSLLKETSCKKELIAREYGYPHSGNGKITCAKKAGMLPDKVRPSGAEEVE